MRAGIHPKQVLVLYVVAVLTACLWPLNFVPENPARLVKGEGLRFSRYGIAYTDSSHPDLAGLTRFTMLLHFSPDYPGQSAWLMSYGLDFDRMNLLVGMYGGDLVVDVHRGDSRARASVKDVLAPGKAIWLAVAVGDSGGAVYVDGVRKKNLKPLRGAPPWTHGYPIVLGSRSDGKFPWNGVIRQLAFFARPLKGDDLEQPDELLKQGAPLVLYDFQASDGFSVPNSGSGTSGPVSIPQTYLPYSSGVLTDITEFWDPVLLWGDILINIVAFMPIGFLLSVVLKGKYPTGRLILICFLFGFSLSLGIELLQSLLPSRWSSFIDVVTNTLGAVVGALIWGAGLGRRLEGRLWPRLTRPDTRPIEGDVEIDYHS